MKKNRKQKVAVIGAGLAGLTAAYRLHQSGILVDIFEARPRVGGRVLTVLMRNHLGNLTEVELGGQNLTDGGESKHILNLINEFSLSTQERSINLHSLMYYQGQYTDFDTQLRRWSEKQHSIAQAAEGARSIGDIIDRLFIEYPDLQQSLHTFMTGYEGVDSYQQSIGHNIETLEYILKGGLTKFHESVSHKTDQIVISQIVGGNARLPLAMASVLKEQLFLNKALTALALQKDSIMLSFSDKTQYEYDKVILANPTTTYRNIDLTHSGIDEERLAHIMNIAYGKNHKILLPIDLKGRNEYRSVIMKEGVSFFNFDETIAILYLIKPTDKTRDAYQILAKGLGLVLPKSEANIALMVDKDLQYELYESPLTHVWSEIPMPWARTQVILLRFLRCWIPKLTIMASLLNLYLGQYKRNYILRENIRRY